MRTKVLLCTLLGASAAFAAQPAPEPAPEGITQERMDILAQKRDGVLSALSPKNLAIPRPKAPFDVTGSWFIDLRRSRLDHRFGPPYPEFHGAGRIALQEGEEARRQGLPYRDTIGQCYPAGMPKIMTRVWPIGMIQLPTAIYMLFGFTNSMRFIYLDGRSHTDPDTVVYTYNGESIGRWEGNALVVHTRYIEPNNHYIDSGIPISDQFEIFERMTMSEDGSTLRIEYTMIDPKNWKGEWKTTKQWLRQDYTDIAESECLPNLNENLPSTAAGQRAMEERARNAK